MTDKNQKQNRLMAVLLNGIAQLEYDRERALSDYQQDYLQNMDNKMDNGIVLGDTTIESPDVMQRVKFVTGNLLHAMKGDDEQMTAAFCAYIATRMPELDQVQITELNDDISIELVFDREYRKQVSIPVRLDG